MISNFGRVVNIRTNRLLRQAQSNTGYAEVNLWRNNKGTTKLVHQLVYTNFAQDKKLKGFVINHKDGNKLNNKFTNLEKITYQKNNLHSAYIIKTHNCNKPVTQLDKNKKIIAHYDSIAQAQKQTGIKNISRAIKNNWPAGGYY